MKTATDDTQTETEAREPLSPQTQAHMFSVYETVIIVTLPTRSNKPAHAEKPGQNFLFAHTRESFPTVAERSALKTPKENLDIFLPCLGKSHCFSLEYGETVRIFGVSLRIAA